MSEVNCRNCYVGAFKEDLCEDEFCEKYKAKGNGDDFIQHCMKPQWTPVSEKLPDNNADFLLQFKSNMGVGFYEDGDWALSTGDGIYSSVGYNEEKPVAWMPLPKPLKMKGEQDESN